MISRTVAPAAEATLADRLDVVTAIAAQTAIASGLAADDAGTAARVSDVVGVGVDVVPDGVSAMSGSEVTVGPVPLHV